MNLFSPLPEPDDELPFEQAMTELADQFADYHCINVFLCESFTSVMSSNEPLRPEVILGAKFCGEAIQARGQEIKAMLDCVRKKSRRGV